MIQTDKPTSDGCIAVTYKDTLCTTIYDFSKMKHWRWDNTDDVLVITFPDGRTEIPRENILFISITNNTPEYQVQLAAWKVVQDATNRPTVPE